MDHYQHKLEMQVRDYECDLQGIVNNANYQNYLEHARHQFLLSRGIDFVALSNSGYDLVVTRVELDYKFPLKPDDRFIVFSSIEKTSKIKFGFDQAIYKLDGMLVLKARIIGTAIDKNGKPSRLGFLDSLFD